MSEILKNCESCDGSKIHIGVGNEFAHCLECGLSKELATWNEQPRIDELKAIAKERGDRAIELRKRLKVSEMANKGLLKGGKELEEEVRVLKIKLLESKTVVAKLITHVDISLCDNEEYKKVMRLLEWAREVAKI